MCSIGQHFHSPLAHENTCIPTSAISMQLHSTLTCTIIDTSSYVVSDVQ